MKSTDNEQPTNNGQTASSADNVSSIQSSPIAEVAVTSEQAILMLSKQVYQLNQIFTHLDERLNKFDKALDFMQQSVSSLIDEVAEHKKFMHAVQKEKEPEITAQKDSVNLTLAVNKAGAIMMTVTQHNKLDAFLQSIDPDLTGKAKFYAGKAEIKLSDIPEQKLALIMQDKRVKDNTNVIQGIS